MNIYLLNGCDILKLGLEVLGFYFFGEFQGVKIELNGDEIFQVLLGLLLILNIRIWVIFGLTSN